MKTHSNKSKDDMKRPDWHSLNMFVKVLSHPDHEVVVKDKLRQLDWLAECILFFCYLLAGVGRGRSHHTLVQ